MRTVRPGPEGLVGSRAVLTTSPASTDRVESEAKAATWALSSLVMESRSTVSATWPWVPSPDLDSWASISARSSLRMDTRSLRSSTESARFRAAISARYSR